MSLLTELDIQAILQLLFITLNLVIFLMSVSSALSNYRDDPLRGYNQALADKQAIGMTKMVKKEREILLKKSNWIPKPLTDQNSIFAMDSSVRPVTKKNSLHNQESKIFNLSSVFRSSVKQTQFSNRTSNIFSESQTQKDWRSSSKKVQNYRSNCVEEVKQGRIHRSVKMNKSSIFNQQNNELPNSNFISIKRINLVDCRNPITEGDCKKIFQSKKRVVRA